MNPLQQMNLAWLDHQERLQKAQRNQLASQLKQKSLFGVSFFGHAKANASNRKVASIQCDGVAVN